jgi:hypothetical protein
MPRRVIPVLAFLLCVSGSEASILNIVNQVRLDSYTAYLDNKLHAHNGDNRGFGAAHDAARTDIYSMFTSFGLTTTLDPFTYSGSTYYNVTAIRPGATNPNSYVILGAHYDSASNAGADDDASGVAAVLEAARVLSNYSFASTLVFVAFDREEQGLVGSAAWAGFPLYAGATIAGMLELDMIAYNPLGALYGSNSAAVYTVGGIANSASTALVNAIVNYSGGLSVAYQGSTSRSDHASFNSRGPSTLLIESNWTSNPHYHKVTDSLNTANYIDYGYATLMTRSAVGWMAMEATELPEPGTLALMAVGLLLVVIRRTNNRF